MCAGLTLGSATPARSRPPPTPPASSLSSGFRSSRLVTAPRPAAPSLSGRSWRPHRFAALHPALPSSLAFAHPRSADPPPHPAPRSHILRSHPHPRARPSPRPLPRSSLRVWISFPAALPGISAPRPWGPESASSCFPPAPRSPCWLVGAAACAFCVCPPVRLLGAPPR